MEARRKDASETRLRAGVFGAVLSGGLNLCLLGLCFLNGLTYLSPPPQEKSLVLDFVADTPPVIERPKPREPAKAPEDKSGTPVQRSEAPVKGKTENRSEAASPGTKGDVEVPEPPREEKIDQASLFRAPKNRKRDTLADQTAKQASDALKAGHHDGKSPVGMDDGTPAVNVGRRNALGSLPLPAYVGQESGVVVVDILVDREGNVKSAHAGGVGTTISLKQLWMAAEKAAMETKFNADRSAQGLQAGTITYKFIITDGN